MLVDLRKPAIQSQNGSGHEIELDKPQAVIDAVDEVP